jgi:hypothetical protein
MTEQLNRHKSPSEAAQALFEYGRLGRLFFRATGMREVIMQLPEAQINSKDSADSITQSSSIFSGQVTIVARRSRKGRFPYSISVIPEQDPLSSIGISSVTAEGAISDLRIGLSKAEDIFTRVPFKTRGRSIKIRRGNDIM